VSTIWIRHPDTKAVVEVPEPALPVYRQSGWDLLPKKDLDDMVQRQVDEVAANEKAMRDAAEKAGATLPPLPPAETGASESPKSKKENG
jgi:hypothetical protein